MIEERHYLEELASIVENYPLFPGDMISHTTANECGRRGWAVRQADGNWIPTAEGLRVHEAAPPRKREAPMGLEELIVREARFLRVGEDRFKANGEVFGNEPEQFIVARGRTATNDD